STKETTWRTTTYTLVHNWPATLIVCCIPLIVSSAISIPWMIQDFPQGLLSFGLIMAGSIIILSGSIAYASCAEVRRRFPTPTRLRICTTCLTQEGVRDTTPDGEKLYR